MRYVHGRDQDDYNGPATRWLSAVCVGRPRGDHMEVADHALYLYAGGDVASRFGSGEDRTWRMTVDVGAAVRGEVEL